MEPKRIKELVENDDFVISSHARTRMFQRNVSTDEIKSIILLGEVIEEYPDDEPCPSVLILGFLKDAPYHVVVAECLDHVRIITVYNPEADKWVDYRKRRSRN
jgi:hypothetical protein